MSWVAGLVVICNGTTHKRDRCAKSAWGIGFEYFSFAVERLYKIGIDRKHYCFPRCMVDHAQMVAGFCLSDQYKLVDISWSGIAGDHHCTGHDQFPGIQSGDCEPREIATNGIN